MWQESGGYIQNFKSIHAKVKKTDLRMAVVHLVVEIQAMIYNAAKDRRLSTNFQANMSKNKNFHFAGALGVSGDWTAVNIKSGLTLAMT